MEEGALTTYCKQNVPFSPVDYEYLTLSSKPLVFRQKHTRIAAAANDTQRPKCAPKLPLFRCMHVCVCVMVLGSLHGRIRLTYICVCMLCECVQLGAQTCCLLFNLRDDAAATADATGVSVWGPFEAQSL